MSRLITLTSDFGAGSHYVAQMKASILSLHSDARIVDVTHSIEPQGVRHAAFIAAEVCPKFPGGSIHVIVVDPGVGTRRRILLARIGGRDYIAPDNGVLSLLIRRHGLEEMHEIAERKYWRAAVSDTFHGRDIMAPVAAHMSLGFDPMQFGPPADAPIELDWPNPEQHPGRIVGEAILIDSFGNLITNIPREQLPAATAADAVRVECRGHAVLGLSRTYADRADGQLVALVGSADLLELAVVGGSAAVRLGAAVGDRVRLTWPSADGSSA